MANMEESKGNHLPDTAVKLAALKKSQSLMEAPCYQLKQLGI